MVVVNSLGYTSGNLNMHLKFNMVVSGFDDGVDDMC